MRHIRSVITALAVLLITLAVSPLGVAAQDEQMATADHPIVGTWTVDVAPEPPQLITFTPGGTLVTVSGQGTGLGSWAATGERTMDLTFNGLTIAPDGSSAGFVTIRASGEVSEDGQSFTGTYTFEPPAMMAEAMGIPAGQLGPGEVSGQRVAVEQMGEPVGPLPDFAELAPGPEESPAG
jgi:hypothetical protein